MSPPPTLTVVGAIFTREDGRVLIAQRAPGGPIGLKWELPGGKVEPGEDPRAALEREVLEELGCRAQAGAIYEVVHHRGDDLAVLLLFFHARLLEGEPRALEHNALAWVTPAEMKDYDLLEPDRVLPAMFEQRFPHYAEGPPPT